MPCSTRVLVACAIALLATGRCLPACAEPPEAVLDMPVTHDFIRRLMPALGHPAGELELMRLGQVQEELRLNEVQKARLKKISEDFRSEVLKEMAKMRALEPDQRNAGLADYQKKAEARARQLRSSVDQVLRPEQAERLRQITVQLRGAFVLGDKEVSEALGITKEQRDRLKAIADAFRRKSPRFRQILDDSGANDHDKLARQVEEMNRKTRELGDQMITDATKVLTPQQREKLVQMKGRKFKLDLSRLPPEKKVLEESP